MPLLYRDLPGELPPPSRLALAYEVAGVPSGPPVVLVPGWTLNARLWDPVAPALEDRYRVVRYDPRGSGRSTSDPRLEYSRAADAEDLRALLDGMEIARAHLVGHSKGAQLCGVFAMQHPERVASLTYVGSAEPQGGPEQERRFRPIASAWVRRVKEVARTQGVEAALPLLQDARLFGKLRASAEGLRRLRRATEGYTGADLLSETPARAFDTEAHAAALAMPVLALCGEEDPFLDECRYAASRIPGARLSMLPRCGHLPMLECPEPFRRELRRFLDAASGNPAA